MFLKSDTDFDGYVTARELKEGFEIASQHIANGYVAKYDTDKNGKLDSAGKS